MDVADIIDNVDPRGHARAVGARYWPVDLLPLDVPIPVPARTESSASRAGASSSHTTGRPGPPGGPPAPPFDAPGSKPPPPNMFQGGYPKAG